MIIRFMQQPTVLAVLLFSLGLCVVWLALTISGPILITLAITSILYAALRPTADGMVRYGMRDSTAVTLTLLLMTCILLLVMLLLLPMVAEQISGLSQRMSNINTHMIHMFDQVSDFARQYTGFDFDPAQTASRTLERMSQQAETLGNWLSGWFSDIAFSLVLIPLLLFFLLRDYRELRNQSMQLLPNRYFELGWLVYNGVAAQLQGYVRGLSIQAMVMTAICTLGFYLIDLDFAPLLGVITALFNLIPFFGISLAKIPPLLVILLSDDPDFLTAALALGVIFFAQAIDATLLVPRIIAKSADLHPLTVMISVALAGYYYGFFGLILVIPIIFSLKLIFNELLKGLRRLHAHNTHD